MKDVLVLGEVTYISTPIAQGGGAICVANFKVGALLLRYYSFCLIR
jgi:hypothetical protein